MEEPYIPLFAGGIVTFVIGAIGLILVIRNEIRGMVGPDSWENYVAIPSIGAIIVGVAFFAFSFSDSFKERHFQTVESQVLFEGTVFGRTCHITITNLGSKPATIRCVWQGWGEKTRWIKSLTPNQSFSVKADKQEALYIYRNGKLTGFVDCETLTQNAPCFQRARK